MPLFFCICFLREGIQRTLCLKIMFTAFGKRKKKKGNQRQGSGEERERMHSIALKQGCVNLSGRLFARRKLTPPPPPEGHYKRRRKRGGGGGGGEKEKQEKEEESNRKKESVSWCFVPCQPQRITSEL